MYLKLRSLQSASNIGNYEYTIASFRNHLRNFNQKWNEESCGIIGINIEPNVKPVNRHLSNIRKKK